MEISRFFKNEFVQADCESTKKAAGGKTNEKRMEQRVQKNNADKGAKQIAVQNSIAEAIGNLRKVQRNMADLVKNN